MVIIDAAPDAVEVVKRVLRILEEGRRTTTYKFAVLLGLVELCAEQAHALGAPLQVPALTTAQLADKVIALYWPQVRPYAEGGTLVQGPARPEAKGGRTLTVMLAEWVAERAPRGGTLPLAVARTHRDFPALAEAVERVLIRWPLPRVQKVGGEAQRLLYDLDWDDGPKCPSEARLRRYQAGDAGVFDNRIQLLPGVAEAFAALAPLLKTFIQQRWAAKVADLNDLRTDPRFDLSAHLFGADRVSLTPVRAPLLALQGGRCFYCRRPLTGEPHVDHFLPWARFSEDALANLVVADPVCNGDKSDRLPGVEYVARWRERAREQAEPLAGLSRTLGWDVGQARVTGAARGLYLGLAPMAPLWNGGKGIEPVAPEELARLRLLLAA